MIIAAPRLFIDGAFSGPGALLIENGLITSIIQPPPAAADVTLDHGFLSPGLIDLHNNGAFGVDCATATPDEWTILVRGLAAHGVTSVLPTIITAPIDALIKSASGIAAAMQTHPGIIGLHLEGPFLSPAKRGAHRADWVQNPAPEAIDPLLADPAIAKALRLVTLAPERPGALDAIARLATAGYLVALGHTEATAGQVQDAANAGATLVTHVFTAQSPLHHRAPGAPGVALTDARLHPCIIVDGLHIDPIILRLAFAACPRLIAVTDSILIAGQPIGTVQQFGGMAVTLAPEGIGRRDDGTIAGAAITLDEGLRRLISYGIAPEIAFAAATCRPAAAMNLTDRGVLAAGARADLVWWSDDFSPLQTWTAGRTDTATASTSGTETPRADLHDLDERATLDIVQILLRQEAAAQAALNRAAPALARLIDAVAEQLKAGGRLFYAGAGTSGRLGLLDAVECGPTFGIADGVIVPLLAGGQSAFINAVEGAEDNEQAAIDALLAQKFSPADTLVGIAASGAPPFTLAAIRHAAALGAITGAIVNNLHSPLAQAAAIAVEINSGAEIIAGSTRLSAGTVQKIALNILSSTVMIRLGKTYGPYMVDLRATNAKLRRRAIRMAAAIAQTNEPVAEAALIEADFHVKTAVAMLRLNLAAPAARAALAAANGSLRRALANHLVTPQPLS